MFGSYKGPIKSIYIRLLKHGGKIKSIRYIGPNSYYVFFEGNSMPLTIGAHVPWQ